MKFLKSAFGQRKTFQLILLFCATLCWVTNIFCPLNQNQTAQVNDQDADTVLAFMKNVFKQSELDKTEIKFSETDAADTLSDGIHKIVSMKDFSDNNQQTTEVMRIIKKYHSELSGAASENKYFVDAVMERVVNQQLGEQIKLKNVLESDTPSNEMNKFRLENELGFENRSHGQKIQEAAKETGFFSKFKQFAKKILSFFTPQSRKKVIDDTNSFIESQSQLRSSTDDKAIQSSRGRQSDFRKEFKQAFNEASSEIYQGSTKTSSTFGQGSDASKISSGQGSNVSKPPSFSDVISQRRSQSSVSSPKSIKTGSSFNSQEDDPKDLSESFNASNLPMLREDDSKSTQDGGSDGFISSSGSQQNITSPQSANRRNQVPSLPLQNNRPDNKALVRGLGGSALDEGQPEENDDDEPDSSRGMADPNLVTDKKQVAEAIIDPEEMIDSLLTRVSDIDQAMHRALTIDGNFEYANQLLSEFFKEGVPGFSKKSADALQKAIKASVDAKDVKSIDFSAIVQKLDLGLTRIQALKLETVLGTIHAQNQLVAASEYFQKQIDAQTLKQEEIKALDDLIKKSMPSQNYVNRSQYNQLDVKTFNLEQDASKLAYIKSAVLANCLSSYSAEKKGLLAAQRTEELADGLTQNWSEKSAAAWRKEEEPDESSGHDFIYFGVVDVYSRAFNYGDSDAGKSFEAKELMLQDFDAIKKNKVVEAQEAFDPVLREVKGIITDASKITENEESGNQTTKNKIAAIKNKTAKQQALYDLNKLSTDLLQAAVYSRLEQKIQPEKARRLNDEMQKKLAVIAASKLALEVEINNLKDQGSLAALQAKIQDQKQAIAEIMNNPKITQNNPLLNRIFAENMDLHRARIEQSLKGKNPFSQASFSEVDKMIQDGIFDSKAHGVAKLSSLPSLKKTYFSLAQIASDVKDVEQQAAAIDNGLLTGKQIPLEQSQKLDAVRLLEDNLKDLSLDDNLRAAVRTVLRDVVDNSSFDPALMSSKIKEMHLLSQFAQDPDLFDSKILGSGLIQTEDDKKQDQEYLKNLLSQQIKDMINPTAPKPFWDVRNADDETKSKYENLLTSIFGTSDLETVVNKFSANPAEIDKRLGSLKIADFNRIRLDFFKQGAYNGPLIPLGDIESDPKNWVNRETALRRVVEVTTDPLQLDVATRVLEKISQKPSPEDSLKYFLQMNQNSEVDPSGDRLRRINQILDFSADLKSAGANSSNDILVTRELNKLARPLIMDNLAEDLAQRMTSKPANMDLKGSSNSYTTQEQRKYADTVLVVKKMLEAEVEAEGDEESKITKIVALQEALTKGSDKTIADAWFGITTPNAATTALEPGQKIALTGTDQEKGILNRDLPLYRLVSLKNPGVTVVNNSMQKIAQAIKSGASVVDVDFNFSNGVVVPESLAVKAKFQQQALLIQPKAATAAQNLQKNAQSPRPRSPVAITYPKQITQDSLQSPQVLTKVGSLKNQTNTNSKPENIGQANEVVGDGVVKTTTNFSGKPNDDSGGADSKNGSPRSPGDALISKSKSGSMTDSQRLLAEQALEQKQAQLQQIIAEGKNKSSLSQKNGSMSPNPAKPATPIQTTGSPRQASKRDQDEDAKYGSESRNSLNKLSKSSSGSGSFKTAEGESSSRSSQSRRLSSSKT